MSWYQINCFYLGTKGILWCSLTCRCRARAWTCRPRHSTRSSSPAWWSVRPSTCSRSHSNQCRRLRLPIERNLDSWMWWQRTRSNESWILVLPKARHTLIDLIKVTFSENRCWNPSSPFFCKICSKSGPLQFY